MKHMNGTYAGCGNELGARRLETTCTCVDECCIWCSRCGSKARGHVGLKPRGEVMSAKVMRRIVKRCKAMFPDVVVKGGGL
jgi:hypothetical protein